MGQNHPNHFFMLIVIVFCYTVPSYKHGQMKKKNLLTETSILYLSSIQDFGRTFFVLLQGEKTVSLVWARMGQFYIFESNCMSHTRAVWKNQLDKSKGLPLACC